MSHELIYTSAQRGIKPGSRGFCTVAATAGIPPRTLTLIESLSGYRHVHPAQSTPHPGNPVNWSHLVTASGESLLSRVADAGLDYSGRSNKIAHHLLLSPEQRTADPVGLMMGGDFVTSWQGQPRWLPPRSFRSRGLPSLPASGWAKVTGDAGWAGVLAAAITDPSRPTCYVIFDQSHELLPLFAEAMTLLPPATRWSTTFSTYYAGLPPGMSCHWRGVLAGSREHQNVPPHDRVIRIDLTSPGTIPDRFQNAPSVTLARTGTPTIASAANEANLQIDHPDRSGSVNAGGHPVAEHSVGEDSVGEPAKEPAIAGPAVPPALTPTRLSIRTHSRSGNRSSRRRSSGWRWVAILLPVCAAIGGSAWWYFHAERTAIASRSDSAPSGNSSKIRPKIRPTRTSVKNQNLNRRNLNR